MSESLSWRFAEVAELADAHGSGPCGSNTLWVRLPSSASAGRRTKVLRLFTMLKLSLFYMFSRKHKFLKKIKKQLTNQTVLDIM